MNTKTIATVISLIIAVILEGFAIREYLGFPNASMSLAGLLFAICGMVFIILAIRLYRLNKKENSNEGKNPHE